MYIPKNYTKKNLLSDILIGAIIALVSIPISMGYAQVAGLSVVYGLYGSLLPILVFALITTSPRFVFGVDAAPAALVGGILSSFEIAKESPLATSAVPVIALLVSLYLLLFYLVRADRLLKFIPQSVMGGFITGIGLTIICMQVPKLFGGQAGTGEIIELIAHIIKEASSSFCLPSFALGLLTIFLILSGRKFFKKLPLQPILMFAGAALTYFFHLDRFGIKTLSPVERGLPPFAFPKLSLILSLGIRDVLLRSGVIAVVILSETLLATSNVALKNGDRINTRREILAYSLSNFASAISGSCPVNGSVSRTGIAGQYGVSSQVMSISASFVLLFILLFATGFIEFLPVPILTGIVISALIGTFEFSMAQKLRDLDKAEFFIFYAAFFSVLFLGTIYGVIVGVLLASVTFILRQSRPASDFLGVVSGEEGFYSVTRRGTVAVPIKNTVIYRFTAPLFYANISHFVNAIENAIKSDTKLVIVDSSGISSVDTSAAERLVLLYKSLKGRGIKFYFAGHISVVNDQLRTFGAIELIYDRVVQPTLTSALKYAGLTEPYMLEGSIKKDSPFSKNIAEFEWAFGCDAPIMLERMAQKAAEIIISDIDAEYITGESYGIDMVSIHSMVVEESKGFWSERVETELLDLLCEKIRELKEKYDSIDYESIEKAISSRYSQLEP